MLDTVEKALEAVIAHVNSEYLACDDLDSIASGLEILEKVSRVWRNFQLEGTAPDPLSEATKSANLKELIDAARRG